MIRLWPPRSYTRFDNSSRDHGRITVADAVTFTGSSRNTLKLHFKALKEQGLLVLHGQGRGSWYGLP